MGDVGLGEGKAWGRVECGGEFGKNIRMHDWLVG